VPLDGGRFATSDLNDLYRRVINRGNRMRRLIELTAPEIIVLNEHRMLQQCVDSLVENGIRGEVITGPTPRPLHCLTAHVAAPNGHFGALRRGKRVDYSAIATAVPRPDLAFEVAVPRRLALALWKPFVYERLEAAGHVRSIKEAKRMVEARDGRALAALGEVTTGYPVVLFPAESRAGAVASLEVTLWDEEALGLPPAVLERLGTEAVVLHVPIDPRACHDARGLEAGLSAAAPASDGGFIARAMRAGHPREVLVGAALRGEVDPVADEDARLLLGRLP
jgi:DNA-directed RNA polymerase subunit beta'